MNDQERAGLNKRFFELYFRQGSIWCEHLDSMGAMEAEVLRKLTEDARAFGRPSAPSRMIVNLDETVITDAVVERLAGEILGCGKRFVRIAFVGVGMRERRRLEALLQERAGLLSFLKDYEKAKEWAVG